MLVTRMLVRLLAVGMIVISADTSGAQDFPHKPIRIVTSSAGDGNDVQARIIAQGISGPMGQPVIVDNRAVVVARDIVAQALPDGYILLLMGNTVWVAPLLQKTPYDDKDFSPVTLTEGSPNALVVHPSVEATSVKELIAIAKTRPGMLNYSSGPAGGSSHLAGELFKSLAGVSIVHVPYKSGGAALTGLLGGEVQITFGGAGTLAPHLKSGKLRALAATSATPSPLFPGLPTVAATVPGYEVTSLTALFAPAKTPVAIINRLNREVVQVLKRPDVKEKLLNFGVQAVGSSPEDLKTTISAEIARFGKLIKDVGIRTD